MKTHITVLEGDKASTKHYTIDPDTDSAAKGKVSTSYLHNSVTVEIENLADLYEVIESTRKNPHAFIIRGRGVEDVQVGVRRTKEDPQNFVEAPTAWVCLDFDNWDADIEGQPVIRTSQQAIENIIARDLPAQFHNVSYIYQWSSSAGLEYKKRPVKAGTNVHLFFMLDRALGDVELKNWLGTAIGPAFDTSTFRTITPIFVGSHVVVDPRIQDVIDSKFGIVVKDQVEVIVPEIDQPVAHVAAPGLDMETTNEIIAKLTEVGAVYKRSGSWLKLRHPREKTPGDWFVKMSNPSWVGHHVKRAMPVSQWLYEFYGVEFDYTQELSVGEYMKKSRSQRFDSRRLRK